MRTNVSTCVADSKCLSRAERVPNSPRGKSSLSLGLGPGLRRDDGSRAEIPFTFPGPEKCESIFWVGLKGGTGGAGGVARKGENMKKFLFILFGVFVVAGAFAAGENVPTSKSYVDSKLAEKQDTIPANDGAARVLTNTSTAGEYGTKGIYDANGEYAAQTQNLVDAATMNAGVQNAIDSEFQCIEWLDPNDHSSDCLLLQLGGITQVPAGYTQLQYIESTGTQYIDTGYKPNNLTNFEIQYLHTGWLSSTDANIPYGCTNSPEVNKANNGLFRTNRGGNNILYNRVAWGNTNADTNIDLPNQFLAELNEWYTDKYLQNKIYINGTLVATSNAPTDISWNSSRTMYLFRRNASTPMPSKIRISYAKIWENESVIKNFIPARRDSDGEIGMYDTVTNTFFTNAGTGEFIAGPIVYLPTGE